MKKKVTYVAETIAEGIKLGTMRSKLKAKKTPFTLEGNTLIMEEQAYQTYFGTPFRQQQPATRPITPDVSKAFRYVNSRGIPLCECKDNCGEPIKITNKNYIPKYIKGHRRS